MNTLSLTILAIVRILWTPQVPAVNVSYEVRRIDTPAEVLLGTTTGAFLDVDLPPGARVVVVARSPFFPDAPPSEPVEIPLEQEQPKVLVHVWRTTNLKTKEKVATLFLDKKDAEFLFLTIETP